MKNKALLLHWWWWNSSENWLPWLKLEFEKTWINTFVPDLPDTDNPDLKKQLVSLSNFNIENLDIMVWHSLGCQLAVKFLEEKNIENSRIILVAPTYPNLAIELWKDVLRDSYDSIEKYYNVNLDFEKINKLNNEFIVFLSNNDPYINMENAKKYYSKLENVKFIDFKDKWHFNKSAWVLELSEILECLK